MIARIAATVVDGELKLDEPAPLPARIRVTVTIEPVSDQAQRRAAWERFLRRRGERFRTNLGCSPCAQTRRRIVAEHPVVGRIGFAGQPD